MRKALTKTNRNTKHYWLSAENSFSRTFPYLQTESDTVTAWYWFDYAVFSLRQQINPFWRWYRAPELLVGDPSYGKEVIDNFFANKSYLKSYHHLILYLVFIGLKLSKNLWLFFVNTIPNTLLFVGISLYPTISSQEVT